MTTRNKYDSDIRKALGPYNFPQYPPGALVRMLVRWALRRKERTRIMKNKVAALTSRIEELEAKLDANE